MATVNVEIGERSFGVAPFKIGDLRKAAPHIDQMNALMKHVAELKANGEDPSMSDFGDLAHALIGILAIGLQKVDPAMTAEAIEDLVDLSSVPSLQEAVMAILGASGFAPKGEAKPSSQGSATGEEASQSNSEE